MFSSTTSSITNNDIPSQISSVLGNEDDMFVHQDFTTQSQYFFPNVADFPPSPDNFNQDIIVKHDCKNNVASDGIVNPLTCDPLLISLLHPRWKKPDAVINKHRHRKIVTAQGSRDRRVRLSIQIARRFFDLQDNLGFDKASQTIDWLLNKSKSAIDEEKAKIKQRHCSRSAIEAAEIGDTFMRNSSVSSSSTGSVAKEIRISMQQQQHSSFIAKQLRAKARERARERTKAKMSGKKIIELQRLGSDFGTVIPNSWNQSSCYKTVPYIIRSNEMSHSIAESILTTKKFNALQNFSADHQSFTSSRQVRPSSFTTSAENWEISNGFLLESSSMEAGYGSYIVYE